MDNLLPVNNEPSKTEPKDSIFSNKGTLLAILLVLVALGFGIFALFNLGSSSEYQGMIKKVEQQTQKLTK
mgnify:CR=1 FL=1